MEHLDLSTKNQEKKLIEIIQKQIVSFNTKRLKELKKNKDPFDEFE